MTRLEHEYCTAKETAEALLDLTIKGDYTHTFRNFLIESMYPIASLMYRLVPHFNLGIFRKMPPAQSIPEIAIALQRLCMEIDKAINMEQHHE